MLSDDMRVVLLSRGTVIGLIAQLICSMYFAYLHDMSFRSLFVDILWTHTVAQQLK